VGADISKAPEINLSGDPVFPPHPSGTPTSFVAFGDSYSAGIGTGIEEAEDDCRHGVHAYPILILADLAQLRPVNTTNFQWLSCTGSTTENILSGGVHSQIDAFNTTTSADFAVMSVGGNDLGFFEVMNACVFRFYSFYSGTCETALQHASEQIAGPDFEQRLQIVIMEILDKVQWEKKPWFMVTITGYARFFNAETEECDACSFGMWWRGPKLSQGLRQRMNDLVIQVNAKIEQSIAMINSRFSVPKVLFVNYDAKFEGHRFCEPHISEPDYNRTDTWFFLVGGEDNTSNATEPSTIAYHLENLGRTTHQSLPPSSSLIDPDNCLGPAQRSGDWGLLALCYMAKARQKDPSLRFADGTSVTANSMWYVPTYYGKTFHPVSNRGILPCVHTARCLLFI
jgi:hypothetical protein